MARKGSSKILQRHTLIRAIGKTQKCLRKSNLYDATFRPNSTTARQLVSSVGRFAKKLCIRELLGQSRR